MASAAPPFALAPFIAACRRRAVKAAYVPAIPRNLQYSFAIDRPACISGGGRKVFSAMNSSRRSAIVRVGNIGSLPNVYRQLGLDFSAALRRARLRQDCFEDEENLVPFSAVDILYSIALEQAGCDHVGLLVGSGPLNLGLPGFLAMQAPTTRIGIQSLIASLNSVDSGGIAQLVEQDDVAITSYTLVVPGLRAKDQMTDTAIAITAVLLRRMFGDGFAPTEVRLPFRAPRDLTPYCAFYPRARVMFDSDEAAIKFPAQWLDRQIDGADPALFKFLTHLIENSPTAGAVSMADQIRRVLPGVIRKGEVKAILIARMFGLHPRTLSRRLAEENCSLHELIEDARFDVAGRLLRASQMSLTQIAAELYYADASAFTRAFRRRFGVPPGEWRKSQAAHSTPDVRNPMHHASEA